MPVNPLDKVKHPWNTDLLFDLCKERINCIAHKDKDYVELWIHTVAREMCGCIIGAVYLGSIVLPA